MPAVDYAFSRKVGSVNQIFQLWAGNVTTDVGIANVIASTVGFGWYRSNQATISTGTCTSGTLGTYSVSSWVQAGSTGMLGWYNFGVPDSCFVSGSSCAIRLTTAALQINICIELTQTDNQTPLSSQTISTTLNSLGANVVQILGSTPVTTAAGELATRWDLGRTSNATSTLALTGTTISSNILVDVQRILGSTPVTTAAGLMATTWDLSRTANLTSTIALTGTTISTNQLVNVNQILGSTPVTSAAGEMAARWDLGRTANLTSTVALTGTSISTNIFVDVRRILGSTPVTTAPGQYSVGITGTQTYNITGNLSGSVGSVTGLNGALLDVSVSSRLAAASYTAPDNTGISAISSKTAQLTFTTTNALDANLTHINETALTGNGSGTPWGPA